jgi:hypothetical protein
MLAAPELVVINLCQRFEPVDDLCFIDRLEQGVAAQAAGKWRPSGAEIKSA